MDTLHQTCIVCGKRFGTPRSNPRKTCSPACQYEARSRAHKGKPSAARMDVTGQQYGELTAIRRLDNGDWEWRCSCGKVVTYPLRYVRSSKGTPSCGHVFAAGAAATVGDRLGHVDGTSISTIKSIVGGKKRITNTSGYTGVRVRHSANVAQVVYEARITYQGKDIYLGRYADIDSAIQARKDAEQKYFGQAINQYEEERTDGAKQKADEHPHG